MVLMTALTMDYVVTPTSSFFKKAGKVIYRSMLISGYSRAAYELHRMGYFEEAASIRRDMKSL